MDVERQDQEPEPLATPDPVDSAAHSPGEFVLPPITRWDVACVAPIMVINLWVLLGRFLTPNLLNDHFVLLELIRGTFPAMIKAGASVRGGHTPLWQALLAPLCILIAIDPFVYWSGRRYGRKILDHLAGTTPKWRRRIAFGERFFKRWGVWTIIFSAFLPASGVFFLAAGEVGMPFLLFAVADIAGTMIWIGLMVGLGFIFNDQANQIAVTITHYALFITLAMVAMVVVTTVRNTRAQLKALPPMNR